MTPIQKKIEAIDTGSKIDWDQFGETPRYLAAGIGVRPEVALTYMTATLGGLGGPFAYIGGALGERHSPALSLVLSVRHPGRARHIEQLALEPATHFNDWQRRQAMAFHPDWVEQHHEFEGSAVKQRHKNLLHELESTSPDVDKLDWDRTSLIRYKQCYQPSVMISSPTPQTYDDARGSVFDESPLIVDTGGSLVRRTLSGSSQQKEWRQLLSRIIEGARSGCDQPAGPRENGPGRIDSIMRTRTSFVIHLPHELTGQSLLHPDTATVYETAVLIPTERCGGFLRADKLPQARNLLMRYRDSVRRVLWSRLDNSGVALALKKPIPQLIEGEAELEQKIDSLPSSVRRYCGGLYDLPLRLLWTALVIDDPKGAHAQQVVPGVLQTARWCVDRQIELVRCALEEEEQRVMREAAAVMYQKLLDLPCPCKLAALLRRYNQQRKDVHLPVLHYLENEGVAKWSPESNEILLLDNRVPEWLADNQPAIR